MTMDAQPQGTRKGPPEAFDGFPKIAIHIVDEQGFFLFTSPAFDRRFGFEPGSLIGKHISLLNNYSPQGCHEKIRGIFEDLRTQGFWQGELFNRTAQENPSSGRSRIYPLFINGCQYLLGFEEEVWRLAPAADPPSKVPEPQAAIRAVNEQRLLLPFTDEGTDQKWTQALHLRAEKKYRHIFENAVDGIYQRTFDGRFITANPACARILGYASPAELTLSTPDPERPFYGSPERQAEFQRLLGELGLVQEFEYPCWRKDNQEIWIAESALAIRDASGQVLFYEGTMKDITERKAMEKKVKFLSFHDRVTGLYNRAFFEEELTRLDTARQLPLSIIIGDVNFLKLMNDAFGHSEGDRLLVQVAAILKECCRKEDVVARLGGDEFAILLPRTNRRSTMEIIERIQLACRSLNRNTPPVSIALGASTKEEPSQDIRQVTQEAEDQMYREKLSASQDHKTAIIDYLRHTLCHQCQEPEDHLARSHQLALPVGKALGLDATFMEDLALLAELHDIGKIAVPPEILRRAGALSPSEWEAIRKHPEVGARIARSIPELASIADAVLSHHEWWNGHGYPRGLSGKEIPLLARIFSIVDAYEVMTRGRPYKPAVSHVEALAEIKREAGGQFDPELANLVVNTVWAGPPTF